MKQILLSLTILAFVHSLAFSQSTPEQLGQLVYQAFKENQPAALDTLTLSSADIVSIYKAIDSTFQLPDDFTENYAFHDNRFKEKCTRIMRDTAIIKSGWKNAALSGIQFSEKELKADDTPSAKSFPLRLLNIYFTSGNERYVLQFKNIHKPGRFWKLGHDVRIREIKNN